MPGIARRALLVGIQLGLYLGEGLLAHDRRHRHLDPFLRQSRSVAFARANRPQRGAALPGRNDPGPIGPRDRPAEPLDELVKGRLGFEIPVEQLRGQCCLGGFHPDRGRIPGPVRVQPVAKWRAGPRQQRACPQLGQPAPPHPLGDQRALVLGYRAADLQQQLVVRVGTHGTVQKLHPATMAGKLVDQQHLVNVVAGQPVRRGHQDNIKIGQRRMITQPVQPRSAQPGAAITVITIDVLLIQRPAALGRRGLQPVKLLLDGLCLGLAGGRHPRIHRSTHQAPPEWSAPPAKPRPLARLPGAPVTGTPDPTGAVHRGSERTGGRQSMSGS
jgi:hypothetical protein